MRRLVWISVALLIMVGIMGYALFTMRNIENVNKRRHEQNAGTDLAAKIVATTETTSIWDKLRATETTTGVTDNAVSPVESDATQTGTVDPEASMSADGSEIPAEPVSGDVAVPVNTTSTTTTAVVQTQLPVLTIIVDR